MKDKKIIAIIILSLTTLIFAYIAFKPGKKSDAAEITKYIKEQYEKSDQELIKHNLSISIQNVRYKYRIDSLNNLTIKTKKEYVTIYKNIDNITNHNLVNEFDSIFTVYDIK
jgi:hypothetical protein